MLIRMSIEWHTCWLDLKALMDWLTTEEAASYLKVRPRMLLVWARSGIVRGHSIGTRRKVWRFLAQELDQCLVEDCDPDMVSSPRLTVAPERNVQ